MKKKKKKKKKANKIYNKPTNSVPLNNMRVLITIRLDDSKNKIM
jgi:hypothetical protein